MDAANSHEPSTSYVMCNLCPKKFGYAELLNRHKKRIHKIVPVSDFRETRIICPLCVARNELKTQGVLQKHLQEKHALNIELVTLQFSTIQEYESWKSKENINCDYAVYRTRRGSDFKEVNYMCNRSNYRGYQPNYKKRAEKSEGTIKIQGMCPSKLIYRLYDTGVASINFWKTHAGHEIDLKTSHLTKTEKDIIVDKLKSGVTVERILKDSRKKGTELQRLNLINRDKIAYLKRKYNIDNKRDCNEMVAAALKIQEWNANGKNFAFFYKPEGEAHMVLKKEDFALGFMNSVMEDKLKTFSNIICMDGTHGTNSKGIDLTVVLVKDDRNAGFPVAFFLTNRLDQEVQEVFLDALRVKLGQNIASDYFMSDDDPKYYNAFVKIMENQPKRLLCTWHVVKNLNIQGKKKIKDEILRNVTVDFCCDV